MELLQMKNQHKLNFLINHFSINEIYEKTHINFFNIPTNLNNDLYDFYSSQNENSFFNLIKSNPIQLLNPLYETFINENEKLEIQHNQMEFTQLLIELFEKINHDNFSSLNEKSFYIQSIQKDFIKNDESILNFLNEMINPNPNENENSTLNELNNKIYNDFITQQLLFPNLSSYIKNYI